MRLYTSRHERLYLNTAEIERFLAVADQADPAKRAFALTLVYTGCRLSEARALRAQDIQVDAQTISFHTLKRRDASIVREVPLPFPLAAALAHHSPSSDLIWSAHGRVLPRITVYRWIKSLMAEAEITGAKASPKGLRHAYGARATLKGVPLHMLQRWMGHSSMKTTAIYATVLGPDQLEVAKRMW